MIYWTFSRYPALPPLRTAQPLERFFSDLEIEEYQRLKISKRRAEWFSSRLLVKRLVQKVMASELSLSLKSITFHKESSGVPFVEIDGLSRVGWLSISHSHDGVLAAFTLDGKVRFGVDVEFIERRSPELIEDFFTPSEIAWISKFGERDNDLHTNLVWSAKEAFLKAIEMGLQMDTRKINIHPPDERSLTEGWSAIDFSVEGINLRDWQLLYSRNDHFIMTICLSKGQGSQLVEIELLHPFEE